MITNTTKGQQAVPMKKQVNKCINCSDYIQDDEFEHFEYNGSILRRLRYISEKELIGKRL